MGIIIQNGKQYCPVYDLPDDSIKALPTVSTASGSVATFDTDMTENLVEVKCQIVAKQASGTPSPDNHLPITVYNSLTLGQDANYDKFLDFNQLIQNGNFTNTSNWSAVRGSISANNNECGYTLSEITTVSTGNRIQQLIAQLKSHKYIAMIKVKVPHASTVGIECYNAGLVMSKSVSDIDTYVDCDVLFSANATSSSFFYWGISDSSGSGYAIGDTVYFKDAQLIDLTQCFGATLADYIYSLGQTDGIAYVKNLLPNSYYDYTASTIETLGTANNDGTGNTYNIPFGQTVANGVLDVTTGKLRITHGYAIFDGSESWSAYSTFNYHYQITLPNVLRNDGQDENSISSHFTSRIGMSTPSATITEGVFSADGNRIRFKNTDCADLTEWISFVTTQYNNGTPVQVVYKLTTPIDIQLDSTQITALLNENNIWCDTNGDTSVKYILSVGKAIS